MSVNYQCNKTVPLLFNPTNILPFGCLSVHVQRSLKTMLWTQEILTVETLACSGLPAL